MIVIMITGCGRAPVAPAPTAVSQPTTVLLADLAPLPTGPQTVTATLITMSAGAALAATVVRSDAGIVPLEPQQVIWLGPVDLPPDLTDNPLAAQVVQAAGIVEGPGSFGPDGAYRYQMRDPTLRPLPLRTIDMALLVQNSALYHEQAIQLRGELLLSASSAILSERSGPGGVPAEDTRQIKLAAFAANPVLAEQLRSGSGEDVRYGTVEITGIWRDNRLYPLIIVLPS